MLSLSAAALPVMAGSLDENFISTGWIAQQFDDQSCLLGAVATALNFTKRSRDYTARNMGLTYKVKYGRADWAKDGTTSNQCQELPKFDGFGRTFGKLANLSQLTGLVVQGHHAVVIFENGVPQHAIVAVCYNNYFEQFQVADPWTGKLETFGAQDLWNLLEPEKWFSYYY